MGKEQIYVGAKFGRWTVLDTDLLNPNSKAKQKVKHALCRCECGTERLVEYPRLYQGRSNSCGCIRKERVQEMNWEKGNIPINTKFGYLTVIEDLGYRKAKSNNKNIRWHKCKCDCGNIIEVTGNNLKSGATKSCGCIKSRGEKIIADLLRTNNINFSQQYTFSDLRTEKDGILRFDFAVFKDNKLYELIEFQGRQHYEGPDGTWSNSDSLKTIQTRDKLKQDYCNKNNIPLIVIPYWDIGNITLESLNLSPITTIID